MTIKVSKPSINIREKLSELEQDTGLKGQELMRSETVAEARTAIGAGRKNLIINGGMDVWQRGVSGSGLNGYFSADRWKITYNTGGINTMTTERVVNTNPNTSSVYALHIHSGGVAIPTNSFERLQTKFEYDTTVMSDGSYRDVTLSFWAKSPNSTIINVRGSAASGGSYDTNLTTSWQKFTYTFSRNIDEINFYFYDGSVPDIQLAEVQLELGSVATEFEHRSFGEELALCQRYFEKSYHPVTAPGTHDNSGLTSCTSSVGSLNYRHFILGGKFSVTKRGIPLIYLYTKTGVVGKIGKYNAETIHLNVSAIYYGNISSLGTYIETSTGSSSEPFVFHWTADAEL